MAPVVNLARVDMPEVAPHVMAPPFGGAGVFPAARRFASALDSGRRLLAGAFLEEVRYLPNGLFEPILIPHLGQMFGPWDPAEQIPIRFRRFLYDLAGMDKAICPFWVKDGTVDSSGSVRPEVVQSRDVPAVLKSLGPWTLHPVKS